MSDIEILSRIILALGFGILLGLETETRISKESKTKKQAEKAMRQRLGGVRTYSILTLFGAFAGILYVAGNTVFAYFVFMAVMLIILAAYILNVYQNKQYGITTELSILLATLVGFAATSDLISSQILLVVIVLLAFILSQKAGIASIVRKVAHREIEDVVKFGIVAVVILPFLPNESFKIADISGMPELFNQFGINNSELLNLVLVNPFQLWQYVVLISGFNLAGYFVSKTIGKRAGLLMTGVIGGFISSTSTTIALAINSRKEKVIAMNRNLAAVSLIANSVSFLQISVLALSAGLIFFTGAINIIALMFIGSLAFSFWLLTNTRDVKGSKKVDFIEYKPFSIGPALQFVALLLIVRVAVQLVNVVLGEEAFIFAISLSGIVGMDVSTITLATMAQTGEVTLTTSLIAFLGANAFNYAAKSFYSYTQGSLKYTRLVSLGLLISFVSGFIGFLIISLVYAG